MPSSGGKRKKNGNLVKPENRGENIRNPEENGVDNIIHQYISL